MPHGWQAPGDILLASSSLRLLMSRHWRGHSLAALARLAFPADHDIDVDEILRRQRVHALQLITVVIQAACTCLGAADVPLHEFKTLYDDSAALWLFPLLLCATFESDQVCGQGFRVDASGCDAQETSTFVMCCR